MSKYHIRPGVQQLSTGEIFQIKGCFLNGDQVVLRLLQDMQGNLMRVEESKLFTKPFLKFIEIGY
jgi:hypothetical protein